MKIKIYLLIVSIVFGGMINSCNDDPSSIGNSILPNEDKLSYEKIDSYTNQFDQSFLSYQKDSLSFGSSSRILLGKFENVTSDILIKFLILLPDSIRNGLDSNFISVKSAWLEFQPNYWIGDSNALRFNIHEINESWNSIVVNQDSIDAVKNSLGPNIQEDVSFENRDSVFTINIDPAIVTNWAFRSFDDTYPINNGIFISPTTENSLAGFQALTSFPQTNYITLNTEFERTGGTLDTIKSSPNVDLHWITGARIADPPNRILMQSAIGVHGKLKFDLSQVPENILLNSAELKLFIDDQGTIQGSDPSDSVYARFLNDFERVEINSDYERSSLKLNGSFYSGDIRQLVQRWIDGEDNNGMELQLSDEGRNYSKVSFYGSSSEVDSLKPRLILYYSKK